MIARFKDPMGQDQTMKGVTTVVSDDEHMYEGYKLGEGGEYIKEFEVVYTRR